MPTLTVGDNVSKKGGARQGVVGPDYMVHPVAEAAKKIESGEWPGCCLRQDGEGKYHLVSN